MGLLNERVVLVSGVGPGLGQETAAAVLREGATAVMLDLDGDRLAGIQAEIDPEGTKSLVVPGDITSDADCERLRAEVDRTFGRLDGLVNVAAYDNAAGGLLDDDDLFEAWDLSSAVNVKGTLRVTRAMAPLLQAAQGSVIVIGSTSFALPRRTGYRLAYGMSKGALATSVYYLAEEFGPHGVRVNTVAPGFKWGPRLEGYFDEQAAATGVEAQTLVDEMSAELSLRRMATDDDVANTVVFFLSDWARSITGQTLFVDGGHVFR